MKRLLLRGLIIFSLYIISCSKSSKCHYDDIPNSLFFLLKKNGNKLPDSILNNLKLSYTEKGNKKYLVDFKRATEEGYDWGIVTTRLIGVMSADQNIKNFIIEYPDGSNDSLWVDYEAPSQKNSCHYLLKQVKFNNEIASPDSSITIQTVYLFNKL